MLKVKIDSPKVGFIFQLACLGLLFFLFAVPILYIELGEDEGIFALQAVRVLQGQLPNIDFPIPYMGGNVFYNAFWMKILGQSFWALRIGLLFIFILYGLGIFYVSSRLMSRGWALLTTATVFSLTVGFYPYLNASWNALLFSFIAFIAFTKALEHEKRSVFWILIAGMGIALSMFMKQTIGLYTAFSLYLIQLLDLNFIDVQSPEIRKNGCYLLEKILVISGSFFIVGYLVFLLNSHSNFHNWLFFGLPTFCIVGGIWKALINQGTIRYNYAARNLLILILGMLSTFLILFIPYILHHNLITYLYEGLILRPSFYIKLFYQDYTVSLKKTTSLVLLLFVGGLMLTRKSYIMGLGAVFTAILLFALFSLSGYTSLHNGVLFLFYQFPLWLIGFGLVFFWNHIQHPKKISKTEYFALAVFIWGVLLYLNTYPVIAMPYVTCSIAPLGILMGYLACQFNQVHRMSCRIPVFIFFGFWLILGCLGVYQYNGQPFHEFLRDPFKAYTVKLPSLHGGLRITEKEWAEREPFIHFINTHSQRKDDFYILADSFPEIYLFTDHVNPTPYDYYSLSLADGTDKLIQSLEEHRVQYIFIDFEHKLVFPVEPKVLHYLNQHYRQDALLLEGVVLKRLDAHG